MRVYLKEIIYSTLFSLTVIAGVVYFMRKMENDKTANDIHLHDYILPGTNTVIRINHPELFSETSFPESSLSGYIPGLYFDMIKQINSPCFLLAFTADGIVFYCKTKDSVDELMAGTYKPITQKMGDVSLNYGLDKSHNFFGYYHHEGLFVASYSRKSLEAVAALHSASGNNSHADLKQQIATFDKSAICNIAIPSDSVNLAIMMNDTILWKPEQEWLELDIFVNDNHLCCLSSFKQDSLNTSVGDTLGKRIETLFPYIEVDINSSEDETDVFYTFCLTLQR